ncbi:MAG: FkbM family methyltransferase [Verrucomicrobiota bacterium]
MRYRLFYGALTKRGYPLLELGNKDTGCSWHLFPDKLNADSIVYSGGIGTDITFEHALVKKFGCSIVLFDPSPTGLETMTLPGNNISQFKFHPVALTGHCGMLKIAPPSCIEEGSWSMQRKDSATLEVPCINLPALLTQNHHQHIDLLKIDIEGSEYEVIDDLLTHRVPIRQLLVEFHHGNIHLPGIARNQTIRAILKLRAAGYYLIDQSGSNHSFLRE